MTNLIQLHPEQNPEKLFLTIFLREDGRTVYVDDRKSIVYYSQRSFAEFTETAETTLRDRLSSITIFSLNMTPSKAAFSSGTKVISIAAYSVSQVAEYCKIYRPDLLIGGEDYLLNAKELHGIGYIQNVIKPSDQVTISQAEADLESIKRIMGGVINTALVLPGYKSLGDRVGWVEPKFNGKELQTRQWVEVHFPDLPRYDKLDMKRLGLEFSNNVRHNHLSLPTNSWKTPRNRYREEHHQVLCTTFHNTRKLGLIA